MTEVGEEEAGKGGLGEVSAEEGSRTGTSCCPVSTCMREKGGVRWSCVGSKRMGPVSGAPRPSSLLPVVCLCCVHGPADRRRQARNRVPA